ncbi:MAG: hypothetical protein LIR50_20220 [Bacillota bacterium]|nr:hypothetical protein [Bacillota bacterium]
MDNKISVFHRVLLWITMISCFIFGLGNYLAPGFVTSLTNVKAPDLISVACIGGFLIAGFFGAAFSLKSGLWSEVRITTYYLMTWSLLNGIRLVLHIIKENDTGLIPNAVSCLIIGAGLAYVVIKRKCCTKNKAE